MLKTICIDGRNLKYELTYKSVKNINIRIKPDGCVYVSANRFTCIDRIEKLLNEKSSFIFKAIDKYSTSQNMNTSGTYYKNGGAISILGSVKNVEVLKGTSYIVISDESTFYVYTPDILDDNRIKQAIDEHLESICKFYINEMCQRFFPCFKWHGVEYPEIRFRKMKSQWGNCRPKNGVLTFNVFLAFAPAKCMEYVVVHEFVHFLYPNHSKDFYKCVEKYLPDWKQLQRELRANPIPVVRKF